MHGYYVSRKRLKNKLNDFSWGQFLMETDAGLVFRGEMWDWSIPDMKQKRIVIHFNWLCKPEFLLDKECKPILNKWVVIKPSGPHPYLDVSFTSYYFQRKKEGREERIKMWTPLGEICRFYKQKDPSNLKLQGGEFLPCYEGSKPDLGPDD